MSTDARIVVNSSMRFTHEKKPSLISLAFGVIGKGWRNLPTIPPVP